LAISVAVITLFWGGCTHLNKTTGLSSLSILNICKQRLDVIFSRRMFSLFWGWSRRWGCSCNKVFDFRCRSCNSFLLIFLLSKALKKIGSFSSFSFSFSFWWCPLYELKLGLYSSWSCLIDKNMVPRGELGF